MYAGIKKGKSRQERKGFLDPRGLDFSRDYGILKIIKYLLGIGLRFAKLVSFSPDIE
jgi:hypothetical protein